MEAATGGHAKMDLMIKQIQSMYIITHPSQYTAASNGLRQSETIDGTNKITHWKHRYPIATYLSLYGCNQLYRV